MTFGQHVRLAGAVVCIIAFFASSLLLNFIGLIVMAIGVVLHIDNLEKRVAALEPKEKDDEEA